MWSHLKSARLDAIPVRHARSVPLISTRSADNTDQSWPNPIGETGSVFLQDFAAGLLWPPDTRVINKAGESWVWPHTHLWGQGQTSRLGSVGCEG